MSSIGFWDQSALVLTGGGPSSPGGLISNQIAPGVFSAGSVAPGITTALPETPNDPWPDNLSPWDTIILAGMRAPGIASLKGGRGKRIVPQETPGASGQIPIFYGYDCAEFSVELKIWTPKQWIWLQTLIKLIMPPPSAKVQPKAVKVDYPSLALLNIYDIYVVHVKLPVVDRYGMMTIEIPCLEYLLPTDVGAGPLQASAEVKVNPDGTLNTQTRTPPTPPGNSF